MAAAGIATAGLLVGVLLGPEATAILLAVVFALTWPLAMVIRQVADDAPYKSPLVVAACGAGGVLCVPGLVRLLTWGASGVLVAVVAAAFFVLIDLVVRRRGQLHRSRRTRQALDEGTAEPSLSEQLEDQKLIESLQCPLTIEELCEVWLETATTLADGAGPRDRQSVAEVRRICLDEFEHRNPDGFQRWIEAGAPGDPGSFLLPKSGE